MASIRKRGDKWQVQVRRLGHRPQSRSFLKRADAVAWSRQIEAEADRQGLTINRNQLKVMTLGDVLRRFRQDETPKKRGARQENARIEQLLRHRIATHSLSALSSSLIAAYRDQRLSVVAPQTVRHELSIIHRSLQLAMNEWGVPLAINPADKVRKPEPAKPRFRRLHEGEFERLIGGCRHGRTWWLEPLLRLAISTAMRRGEILSLRWNDIDLRHRVAQINHTKNGHPRTIPLQSDAVDVLGGLPRRGELIIPANPNAVNLAWQRLTKRVAINDLRFHDLRHEGISRLFELGLSVAEVALISGHRDPRMLFRYTHLSPKLVGEKLIRMEMESVVVSQRRQNPLDQVPQHLVGLKARALESVKNAAPVHSSGDRQDELTLEHFHTAVDELMQHNFKVPLLREMSDVLKVAHQRGISAAECAELIGQATLLKPIGAAG
jgi:integrase